jgi:hypothetical protein
MPSEDPSQPSAAASPEDRSTTLSDDVAEAAAPWWGTFVLDEGTVGRWRVGPLTLWIRRTDREWVVYTTSTGEALAADSGAAVPSPDAPPSSASAPVQEGAPAQEEVPAQEEAPGHEETPQAEANVTATRYSFRAARSELHVRPALPDRPVVVRPEEPVVVSAGETMTMYVSMPLWVAVEYVSESAAGGGDPTLLFEHPSHRPSDTWFGPSTREGSLCYALRTSGRTRLDDVPRRFHRAVTPLQVENRAQAPLPVERIQVPAPHLALYASDDGLLWTPAIDLVHEREEEGADVEVRPGAPAEAGAAEEVRAPRQTDRTGLAVSTFRALGALFGQ